jgi:hypothetical protein
VAPGLPAPGEFFSRRVGLFALSGWNRPAEIELALNDRAEFGLSRFADSRGLDELERAGLVSVYCMTGRSPVATILDANAASG